MAQNPPVFEVLPRDLSAYPVGDGGEGEHRVSIKERNLVVPMGPVKSEVCVAGPCPTAASALTGYIADPRTV